jgi:hypothetical protein
MPPEESLKVYRDLKNVVDTAFDEGKVEGIQQKPLEDAKKFKDAGVAIETIHSVPDCLFISSKGCNPGRTNLSGKSNCL